MRFETRAVRAGQEPDSLTGAVNVPVYQSSTFRQEAIGRHKGYEYSRTGNPTRSALENALRALEGGKYGLAFSSGVAASAAVFSLANSGERVLCGDDMYGGTYRLLETVFRKWGVKADYADSGDEKSFAEKLRPETAMVWLETPTNPLLKIIDIQRIAELAHESGALLAVDNTFASPCLQNPLALGADIAVHSTTKYIAGHSDIVGGAAVLNDKKLYMELEAYQNTAGAVPGPWDCYLALRGVKTLPIRMRAHQENASLLAECLSSRPEAERVYYPGLKTNETYELAKRQMSGFGGMLSLELKGGRPAAEKFISGLELFLLAESLGGVESLVSYPAGMTHASMPPEERKKRGISDGLVRLSAGIENGKDLREDVESALDGL